MTTSEEIVVVVKALPEETRLQIIDMLLESVYSTDEEIDEAWARVILRRGREIEQGKVELIPAEQVLEEAREILRSK